MKKLMLMMIGMLFMLNGCTAVAVGTLKYGSGLFLGIALFKPDLDVPGNKGGVWYIDPNDHKANSRY